MDPDDNAPPVQLSKRDKRRTQLMDRLRELTDTFSLNKDTYYREQLGAIQEDMALILHAVPYVEDPTAEPTHELLSTMHKISRGDPKKMQALQQGDLSAAGNRLYHEFMDEIRDAMERRDATLTSFASEYEKKIEQLNTTTVFVRKTAEKEHHALSSTIRDRLINSINEKKRKLNRDMSSNEGIDNSNALSYNPAQYSSIIPPSPGGVLGKRSMRHRRDMDDLTSLLDQPKRKRRAVDESRGSPAPRRREPVDLDNIGVGIPLAKFTSKSQDPDTPLYSVDKLFTEKELSLLERQASEAAHKYIIRHKFVGAASSSQTGSSEGSRNGEDKDGNGDSDEDSPLIAPAMDRATRSTRGIGGGMGGFIGSTNIEVIADRSLPTTFTGQVAQMPRLPPPLYASMTKYFGSSKAENLRPNLTEGISGDELAQDMKRIEWGKRVNSSNNPGASLDKETATDRGVTIPGDRRYLAAAIAKPGTFPVWLGSKKREEKEEQQYGVGKRAQRIIDDDSGGASKQTSRAGSEAGGVEMSREGSKRGNGKGA